MDLLDSKNVNNRIKKRTVVTAVLVHLYLTIITLGFWLIPLTLFGISTSSLLRNDIDEAKSSANSFNKALPFKYFGQVFTHIQHIFHPISEQAVSSFRGFLNSAYTIPSDTTPWQNRAAPVFAFEDSEYLDSFEDS